MRADGGISANVQKEGVDPKAVQHELRGLLEGSVGPGSGCDAGLQVVDGANPAGEIPGFPAHAGAKEGGHFTLMVFPDTQRDGSCAFAPSVAQGHEAVPLTGWDPRLGGRGLAQGKKL